MSSVHWKTAIDDLRASAQSVTAAPAADTGSMSARTTAACLTGIVGLVSRRFSVDVMQRACADLSRHSCETSFRELPAGHDGVVPEPVQLIAVVARSLLPIAGVKNLRAALAFWASEDDPAVWQSLAA